MGNEASLTDQQPAAGEAKLTISITYCRSCHFLPRAAWVAQELLHTFGDFVESLALVPGGGGQFDVHVNGELVFANRDEGRFPEMRELRELVAAFLESPPVSRHHA
ncbi:MAG: SelT/SelW/SelH family protein [Chloroflexi bacterium]|nr:SelT/SelW/SelH family protein [Chloroflexota bacterium]